MSVTPKRRSGLYTACRAIVKGNYGVLPNVKHGGKTAYRYGCRCEVCLDAQDARERRHREDGSIPRDDGRARLAELMAGKSETDP